jgi:adenosylcobinamide amidohydrolase
VTSRAASQETRACSERDELRVRLKDDLLIVRYREPVRAASWAIVGGGLTEARAVAWLEVRDTDLRPPVDPRRLLRERLRTEGLTSAIGLLTSRRVDSYSTATAEEPGVVARCIATVGLGNALRAGDPPGVTGRIGTINLLVHVGACLSDEALLEASAIATEAKCAVVLEAGLLSRSTGRAATGTGTDCTVVTARRAAEGVVPGPYAGKHTAVGCVIGRAVESAISMGVEAWCTEARVRRGSAG